jgi:hypothetical protein
MDCQLSILSILIRKVDLVKDKRFIFGLIALLVAILVVAGRWIALNTLPFSQSHALYDYSDSSASLPRQIMRGGSIHVDWWGYPAPDLYAYTKPPYATVPMELVVLIVPEATFRAQSPYCGKQVQAQVIDVVHISNRTGASSYVRTVTIPSHLQPGQYELMRVVHSPVRSSCFSNVIDVSA